LFFLVLLIAGCSGGETEVDAVAPPSFDIDTSRITVSGVSSGAYMAGQLHVAHSATISGAGLIAGGPYWCASGAMQKGLGPCMNGGDMGLEELHAYAETQAEEASIDALDNLGDDKVWLFLGALDVIINEDVPAAAQSFYASYLPAENITLVNDIEAPHGMPTLDVGADCASVTTPFLNACNYDAAGELLRALSGPLNARTTTVGDLVSVTQPGAATADMLESAFLYVPPSCANGESCGVHIALHGCQQSSEFVGDAYASGAGYNEWAESNRLLVLYPQVASSKFAPLNPLGCWDWWGYAGDDYATRSGAQVSAIMATLESLKAASP
jgi:hypothetical protein